MRSVLPLLCLAPALAACASVADRNCDLRRPPKESGINELQGKYVFIYPRALLGDYSGCQIMWGHDGVKWYVLRVRNGQPTELAINIPQTGELPLHCLYGDAGLVKGDANICPGLDALKRVGGLPVMPEGREAAIPPEADLRGR